MSSETLHHRQPADPHVSTLSAGLREPEKHGQLMAVRKAQIGWMSLSCERSASVAGDKHTRRGQKPSHVSFESRTAAGSNCSPFRRQAGLFRLISSFNELLLEFREKQRFKAAGDVWLSLCFIAEATQCLQTHRRTYSKHSEGYTNMHTLTTQFYLYTQWKTQRHQSAHNDTETQHQFVTAQAQSEGSYAQSRRSVHESKNQQ